MFLPGLWLYANTRATDTPIYRETPCIYVIASIYDDSDISDASIYVCACVYMRASIYVNTPASSANAGASDVPETGKALPNRTGPVWAQERKGQGITDMCRLYRLSLSLLYMLSMSSVFGVYLIAGPSGGSEPFCQASKEGMRPFCVSGIYVSLYCIDMGRNWYIAAALPLSEPVISPL